MQQNLNTLFLKPVGSHNAPVFRVEEWAAAGRSWTQQHWRTETSRTPVTVSPEEGGVCVGVTEHLNWGRS